MSGEPFALPSILLPLKRSGSKAPSTWRGVWCQAHWPNSTESQPLVLKLRFMVLERLPRLILDPARGPAGLWAPDNACDTRAPADSTGVSLSCQAPQGLLSPLNADKESPFGLQIDTNCCNCCLVSKLCLTLLQPHGL